MKKKITAVCLVAALALGTVPATYAATVKDYLQESGIISAENPVVKMTIDVPTEIGIKEASAVSYTTNNLYITNDDGATVDFKATVKLENVTKKMSRMESAALALASDKTEAEKAALQTALNNSVATGSFEIKVEYPKNNFLLPDSVKTGTGLAGFTTAEGKDLNTIFEETDSRVHTEGTDTNTLTVKVKVKDGVTFSTLKANLADLVLTCEGVNISSTGTYEVKGSVTGSTKIKSESDEIGDVTYKFDDGKATVIISKRSTGESLSGSASNKPSTSEKKKITIAVDGSSDIEAEYNKGDKVKVSDLDIPTKPGYTFDGLYLDEDLTKPVGDEITVDGDIKLFVKWKKDETATEEKPSITVVVGGDSNVEFEYNKGDKVKVEDILMPNKPGYTLEGLFLDEEMTQPVGEEIVVDENVKIYAKWKKSETPVEAPLKSEEHFAYINGYPNKNGEEEIRPNNNITREEVASVFYRILTDEAKAELYSKVNGFKDVSENRWSNEAISTVANGGYIKGYDDGTFNPGGDITRAEFVTIAARFYDVKENSIVDSSDLSDIQGHWAKSYINYAVSVDWLSGYEDGTFRPDKPITRAEVIKIINNILDRHVDAEGLADVEYKQWVDNDENAWYYYDIIEASTAHKYEKAEETGLEKWTELFEAE